MLFSFRSRYWCAIGLKTYLELEVDVSHIQRGFPTPPTLGVAQIHPASGDGTITLCGVPFQETFPLLFGPYGNPNHIRTVLLLPVQFALFPFRSPLLRKSRFDFFSCPY